MIDIICEQTNKLTDKLFTDKSYTNINRIRHLITIRSGYAIMREISRGSCTLQNNNLTPRRVWRFSAGWNARVLDRFTKEKRSENKKLNNCCLTEEFVTLRKMIVKKEFVTLRKMIIKKVCDTSQNDC